MSKKNSKSFRELKQHLYKTRKEREIQEAKQTKLNNELKEMQNIIRRIKEYGKKREND